MEIILKEQEDKIQEERQEREKLEIEKNSRKAKVEAMIKEIEG